MFMTPEHIADLIAVYRDGLLTNTIPFWKKFAEDKEFGGYMTCVDRQGHVFDTDKGIWHQGRFAWMLGHLYNNVEQRPEWLESNVQTCEFLRKFGFDPKDGQMWFQTTRDGQPIRKRRYAFSESFAAVAFGENARATQSAESAEIALKCLNKFVTHVPSPEKFTDVRPMKGMAPNMIKIITAQELRKSINFDGANAMIDEAIEEIRSSFMKPDIRCVMEAVAPDGSIIDHADGRMLNPGHAIEGAWFIMNEGKIRNIPEYVKMGLDILDWMWERGWDKECGGLFYFRDVYSKPVTEYWHDMKFWWNHNETIIATLLAYQLTGDAKYAKMHKEVHEWSYRHFPDNEYGEWYGYLRRDGSVSNDLKGNIFKGCFHLPRMELVCWQIANEIQQGKIGMFK